MSNQWLQWAKKIQAISQAGLTYTKDMYDRERYEELRNLSAEIISKYTDLEIEKVRNLFTNEKGYQTPKVDVRAVIFHQEKILLVKEASDGRWSLPGGYCDIGLSPTENAIKEVKEETGYDVIPQRLLAILDTNKEKEQLQPYQYYKLFILCNVIGGQPMTSIETKDICFFAEHDLPELSIRRNVKSQLLLMFDYLRNPSKEVTLD
ncbi:MAG: NUDIX hydrolase [Bacillus sp. (in: firmicutes)]